MEVTIDGEGYLIDESGERVEINGAPVKPKGVYRSQVDVDKFVGIEKSRWEKENRKRINELQAKIDAGVSPEKEREYQARIDELEAQTSTAEERANKAAQRKIEDAETKAKIYETRSARLLREMEEKEERALITELSMRDATDPADVYRWLRDPSNCQRVCEPVLDENKEPTGKFNLTYRAEVEDKELGKKVIKPLTPQEAVAHCLAKKRDYRRGANTEGSGSFGNQHQFAGGISGSQDWQKMDPTSMIEHGLATR